jgi:hypothetical protein
LSTTNPTSRDPGSNLGCGAGKPAINLLSYGEGLRVFENRVLRRIFGPKRNEVTGWSKLHNEELHALYSSPSVISMINCWEILE